MAQCCYPILLVCTQQRIQLPGMIERHQLIAATDVLTADKDLRDRGPTTRATDRLLTRSRPMRRVNLADCHALAAQQGQSPSAERAPGLGVDFNVGHSVLLGRYSGIASSVSIRELS